MVQKLKAGTVEYDVEINTESQDKAKKKIISDNKKMEKSFISFGNVISTYLGVQTVRGLASTADSMTLINARIKNLTKSTDEFNRVYERIFDISQKNGVALKDTADAFQIMALSQEKLGATSEDILELVETIQQLGVISGASGDSVSGAAVQLAQALASGVLSGDELKSIMENMPALAESIAVGLGKDVGELKKLGSEGKLVAKPVFESILQTSKDTEQKFKDMPRTFAQATNELKNGFVKAISDIDKKYEASSFFTGLIGDFGKNMQSLSDHYFTDSGRIVQLSAKIYDALERQKEMQLLLNNARETGNKRAVNSISRNLSQNKKVIESLKEEIALLKKKNEEESKEVTNEINIKSKIKGSSLEQQLAGLGIASDSESILAAHQNTLDKIEEMERQGAENIGQIRARANKKYASEMLELDKEASREAINQKQDEVDFMADLNQLYIDDLNDMRDKENKIRDERLASEIAGRDALLQTTDDFLANMSGLLERSGKENTALAKALFMAQRAIAVANIIVSTHVAAAKAAELGPILGIPAGALAMSMGYASAGIVAGTSVADAIGGGRQSGGRAIGGLTHKINERGAPEVFERMGSQYLMMPKGEGGNVIPIDKYITQNSQNSNSMPSVTIVNETGVIADAQVNYVTSDRLEIRLKKAEQDINRNLAFNVRANQGDVMNALNQTSNIQRNRNA